MSARHKLNAAVLNGALCVALTAGLVTESVAVFLAVLAVLLVGALHSGELRPESRRNKRGPRP